jgi:hypothetical protein
MCVLKWSTAWDEKLCGIGLPEELTDIGIASCGVAVMGGTFKLDDVLGV